MAYEDKVQKGFDYKGIAPASLPVTGVEDGSTALYQGNEFMFSDGVWIQTSTAGSANVHKKSSDLQVDDPIFNEQIFSNSAAVTATTNSGISHKKNWQFQVELVAGDTIEIRGYLGSGTPTKLNLIDLSTGSAIVHPITASAFVAVDPPNMKFDSIDVVKVGTTGLATVQGIAE